METDNRVVVLIDMDCFYCQVEEKMNPELRGKPIAVVQYNPWKGGGIIAVNYVARALGVNRHMRGDEAKEKCPEINLPSVPCTRGKADISRYRDAGKEVARVLQKFTPLLERASIDEAYLDITAPVLERLKTINASSISTDMIPNTFALGYDSIDEFMTDANGYGNGSIDFDSENAKLMLVGALVVSEIRAAVYEETGYRCSAGISHNKILAKLVCGMNKPNKQTILPKHSVSILYKTLPLKKVKHLGGKFGYHVCAVLKVQHMGELQNFTEKELQTKFDEKNGTWLYNIARGINYEPVQARFNPKSIGCCKNFKGKSALLDLDSLKKWLKELGDEIEDRLEKDAIENNRTPRQIVVSFATQLPDGRDTSNSRSYNFAVDDELCGDLFSLKGLELVMDSLDGVKLKGDVKNKKLTLPIKFLGLSVGKFEDHSETKKTRKINDFFTAGVAKESSTEKVNKTVVVKTDSKNDNSIESKMDKKPEKDYIMKKFFQATDKIGPKISQIEAKPAEDFLNKVSDEETLFQSDLEDQESFFAKFLHRGGKSSSNNTNLNKDKNDTDLIHPTNPICNVIECGENSNDTNYSSSTINNEINNSIALFEENPQDVERVSGMRTLLNNSKMFGATSSDNQENERQEIGELSKASTPTIVQEFQCPDCRKMVQVHELDTHADYHLALRLREEERQEMRKTKAKQTPQPVVKTKEVVKEDVKIDTNTTIANFFEKIDENVPLKTCGECGRKIKVDKFLEHSDFHEAQKLSKELNKKAAVNNFSSNSVKRKRKSLSPVKKPKVLCKSIDSFFK